MCFITMVEKAFFGKQNYLVFRVNLPYKKKEKKSFRKFYLTVLTASQKVYNSVYLDIYTNSRQPER